MSNDDVALHLVSVSVRDPVRRSRIRRILRPFGEAVGRDLWEVVLGVSAEGAMRAALLPELEEGDDVRIYTICARCRSRALVFGDREVGGDPAAILV